MTFQAEWSIFNVPFKKYCLDNVIGGQKLNLKFSLKDHLGGIQHRVSMCHREFQLPPYACNINACSLMSKSRFKCDNEDNSYDSKHKPLCDK